MKRICSWCGMQLGVVSGNDDSSDRVTGGVCKECMSFFSKNTKDRDLGGFLESLDAPVAAVDQDRRIQFANEKACALLGKSREDLQASLPGDALQCAYARLPGGCGQTEHCKACTIRIAIFKTYETGEDQKDVSRVTRRVTEEGEKNVRFIITTRKSGDVVLLRVDEVLDVVGGEVSC